MNSWAPAMRGGALDVGVGGVGLPVRDVGADRVGEEERVLEHDADLVTHRLERAVAHVGAVDADAALLHVVEAGEEQAHRRLPRARRAHEGDGLAGGHVEREVTQHRLGAQVPVGDVVEVDPGGGGGQRGGVGLLGDERVGVEQLEDPFGAGARLLGDRDHPREHADRREELHQVGGERQERPDADLPLDRQPAAEREHAHLAERGNRLQRRRVTRLEPYRPHPRAVQALGGVGEAGQLAVLLAEALHDPHAADRLVDDARDLTGALERVPLRGEHRLAQPQRHEEQRGHGQQHDHRQQR